MPRTRDSRSYLGAVILFRSWSRARVLMGLRFRSTLQDIQGMMERNAKKGFIRGLLRLRKSKQQLATLTQALEDAITSFEVSIYPFDINDIPLSMYIERRIGAHRDHDRQANVKHRRTSRADGAGFNKCWKYGNLVCAGARHEIC